MYSWQGEGTKELKAGEKSKQRRVHDLLSYHGHLWLPALSKVYSLRQYDTAVDLASLLKMQDSMSEFVQDPIL